MDSHECVPPESKVCSKCGTGKPLSNFSFSRGKRKAECKACFALYHREYYRKNAERVIARTQAYKAANPEKVAVMMVDWYQRNKEHVAVRGAEYRSREDVKQHESERQRAYYDQRKVQIQAVRKVKMDTDEAQKQRFNEYQKRYFKENIHLFAAKNARRRLTTKAATPAWADLAAIKVIYKRCAEITAESGVKHAVDHIVPLHGKNVCGLHVECNLRIITELENLRKCNKHPEG